MGPPICPLEDVFSGTRVEVLVGSYDDDDDDDDDDEDEEEEVDGMEQVLADEDGLQMEAGWRTTGFALFGAFLAYMACHAIGQAALSP
ncbi:hypothetical protein TWF132_011479 [Orbilia oligospora]|nr:hypothetical protein TWF132_011479 [Orbilia oligospora]